MTPVRIDTPPVIRKAVAEDLPALTALLKALFSIEEDFIFDEEKQRRGLFLMLDGCGKHRCMLVAELSGEVVGMVSAQVLVSTAEGREAAVIEDVVVREDCRGGGIGAALMDAIGDWACGRGISRLQLLADRHNEAGIGFYRKQGWKTTQLICLRKMLDA
jgi:ribosomal protein S18 acetylase RimI-like enzyme